MTFKTLKTSFKQANNQKGGHFEQNARPGGFGRVKVRELETLGNAYAHFRTNEYQPRDRYRHSFNPHCELSISL